MNKSQLLTPLAILIAGAIIAGAVFLRDNKENSVNTSRQENQQVSINLDPVTEDDRILGSPEAPIILVEYSDTECPFCKRFHETMHTIIDNYGASGEVAWVYRHFPITQLHSKAVTESRAIECASEQGGNQVFWSFTDKIYEITPANNGLDLEVLPQIASDLGLNVEEFNSCLESDKYTDFVQSQVESAERAGAQGTPYSVLVFKDGMSEQAEQVFEGIKESIRAQVDPARIFTLTEDRSKLAISGALPIEMLKALIDAQLAQ